MICTLPIRLLSVLSLLASSFTFTGQTGIPVSAHAPDAAGDPESAMRHSTPEWKLVEPHLPNPSTASAAELEMQGDLLRIRKFLEDALDYYGYAQKRGGDSGVLLNKIGVTQLEMGNETLARAYFQQAVKVKHGDTQSWNNLGAVQFMDHDFPAAIRSYKHAIKLNKKSAVSHSNLGIAYIEAKDVSSAKSELTLALKLDPDIFQRTASNGSSLHMITTGDRANFCFQMAKVYARLHNEPEMLHSLETAAEAGFDVQGEMAKDYDLARYVKDPRVVSLLMVAKSLRDSRIARSSVAAALPPAGAPVAPAR
ncbi:tetratricopeptide repeat protein [Granulicella aggregans]|jgi:Flp pilus assembly protein TadD|uniref:tetratricopeptide repeat protein n=1 Tax=Granulicella aggregans TaxID=474949 RepID=UPI0021DF825D|nr:tetratricopeptide repeat protein [Granulicella aggregans]